MKIRSFIWLKEFEEKIRWKHHLEPEEVEEIFGIRPLYRLMERGERAGEDVYAAHGQTEDGRYVMVFFIYKLNNDALIVSARDMNDREQRYYEKHI